MSGSIDGLESLPDLFAKVSAQRPGSVAVSGSGESLTYAELDEASRRLAERLRARGVGNGDLVGVRAVRSVRMPVAILGILRANAAYVPLDPAYPMARLNLMIDDARVRFVVGDTEPGAPEPLEIVTTSVGDGRRPDLGADDPAYVIYTSGSTGRPKGCVVTHRNVLALLESALPLFDVGERDRWTVFHSISFDFSVWELWGAFATGATAVIVPELQARSPADFLELLRSERVTVVNQVPSVFRFLVLEHEQVGRPDLDLRYVIFGGESVDLELLRRFAPARRPVMVNMYGITETTVHVTAKILDEHAMTGDVRSPIGVALPHLRVELRDESGTPVPPGRPGEMWIAGTGVAAGYLNRPELTAERFVTDGGRRFYRSGDSARRLPNGELEYLGRIDRQIKLRGFRIEPGEIEAVLRRHEGVQDVAVTVISTSTGAQHMVACVVPAVPTGLRDHAAAVLPRHMVPDRYVSVTGLPLTPSGKLDRTALSELARRPPKSRRPPRR